MGLRGSFLHVGFGGDSLPEWAEGVTETTLDIDPRYNPDYVASMTDMGDVGNYDFVYSCHVLEHIYPHEIKKALLEMRRVLVDGGTTIAIVPTIENVKPNHDALYDTPAGPVCGLDIIYGMARLVKDNPYMAHKYGFIMDSLKAEFKEAGYKNITGTDFKATYSIMITGEK